MDKYINYDNRKMKVSEEIAHTLEQFDRIEENISHRKRRHETSLEELERRNICLENNLMNKPDNVEDLVAKKILIRKMLEGVQLLSSTEQDLIKKRFLENRTLEYIANDLQVTHPAVIYRINKIFEKLLLYINQKNI